MNKTLFGLLMAGLLVVPHTSPALGNDSLLRKTDWKNIEAFLPPVPPVVPSLDLDPRTKLPKTDFPFGKGNDLGALAAQPLDPHRQVTTAPAPHGLSGWRM